MNDAARWAELEAAYASAVYTIDDGSGPAPAMEVAGRHGVTYVIITAHNPLSVVLTERENARRNERLRAALGDRVCLPAVGGSADGRWSEPSFAVPETEDVFDLAEQFEQAAVLVVDGSSQSVRRTFRGLLVPGS